MADGDWTIRVPVAEPLRSQMLEWQRELEEIDRLMGVAIRRQLYENWQDRLLRKKAAIASVGFEVGLVEFDWPAERSVRIEVESAAYFPVGTGFVTFDAGAYGEARGYEVFAVDGDELRVVPRP